MPKGSPELTNAISRYDVNLVQGIVLLCIYAAFCIFQFVY